MALDSERASYLGEQLRPRIAVVEVREWLRLRRNGWPAYALIALGVDFTDCFMRGSVVTVMEAAENLARKKWLASWAAESALGVVHVLPPAKDGDPFRIEWRS